VLNTTSPNQRLRDNKPYLKLHRSSVSCEILFTMHRRSPRRLSPLTFSGAIQTDALLAMHMVEPTTINARPAYVTGGLLGDPMIKTSAAAVNTNVRPLQRGTWESSREYARIERSSECSHASNVSVVCTL
jgi:hypothetical protein